MEWLLSWQPVIKATFLWWKHCWNTMSLLTLRMRWRLNTMLYNNLIRNLCKHVCLWKSCPIQNGETALYYASKAGKSQVAEFLIDNEANVNELNKVCEVWSYCHNTGYKYSAHSSGSEQCSSYCQWEWVPVYCQHSIAAWFSCRSPKSGNTVYIAAWFHCRWRNTVYAARFSCSSVYCSVVQM